MTTLHQLFQLQDISRLDKRVLLSRITGFTTAQLISRDDSKLSVEQLQLYQNWVQRALAGEPIAYILSQKEFYSREFKVTPATLIPRPETELLLEKVLELATPHARVVDLGTGSGCLAISAKLERPDLQVIAVDKFVAALQIAQENALNLAAEVEFIHSDWFTNLSGKFDLIASNPPYIEANDPHLQALQFEPQTALSDFADGLSCIRLIANSAREFLNPNGWLIIEHGYNQAHAVQEIFRAVGLVQIVTLQDYAGIDRITLAQQVGS